MSSKQLTAKVRLDVTQAEKKIKLLERQINKLNATVNKQAVATRGISVGFDKAANSASKFDKNVRKSANSVGFLTKKVKLLANAYLGVMGAKAIVNTSDNITRAKNQLNNLPGGNPAKTQETMDKVYAAAIRSRSSYTDMLSNVGKTMTLAPEAFQNNEDNAIKFQEIMAKSYALGNKSAAEQASSMYQLVQALGSGVLQGDELRSVREGATLAYKKIEDFAKSIYGAEENLKDLASEGKITSDLVVAAILKAEGEINQAFENTNMTFSDAMTNIQSKATKAFEPVLTMMNEALNSNAGKAIINGIGNAIIIIANCVLYLFNLVKSLYQFVVDNWSAISDIIYILGNLIGLYLIVRLVLLINTFKTFILKGIYGLATMIGEFIAMGNAVGYATAMSMMFGINLNMWAWVLIAVLAVVIITIVLVADSFVDACGIIVGAIYVVLGIIHNVIAFVLNLLSMLMTMIVTFGNNIVITFSNAWNSAKASFWEWVSECLNGTSVIAKAVSKIAELFGLDDVSIGAKIDAARGKIQEYEDVGAAIDTAASTVQYANVTDMYNKGYGFGSSFGQGITDKFNNFKNKLGLNNTIPDPNDDKYNVGGIGNGYDLGKALDGINDNTGKIADSMDLSNDDLEYLRRVADMEWKKEFTTASIVVDMTNNNQISGDGDLDGIVTRLADKLYEEMNVVANGVYAY